MNDAPDKAASMHKRSPRRSAIWRTVGIAVTSIALLVAAAVPAAAAELMRVTFVRHGESAGNASGLIDTSVPGPVLTPLGQQQAQDVVGTLGDNNYDAIYASTMVRTQLTATPMSQYLRLPIQVLPGIQEIEAGVFEGTPEANAASGYGLYPLGWTFPGVIPQLPVSMFNKSTVLPGTTLDGYGFDDRVKGALQTIYDNGDRNPVVFSHGGTIMFWTLMNVSNLTIQQKLQLLQTAALGNTDYVVIEGNPEDGWTLVNWNGQQFAPEPTLGAEIALQTRTLTRQLAAAANQVAQAFATHNIGTILTAINRAVADATYSVVKFNRAVSAKLIGTLSNIVSPPSASDVEQESSANTVAAAATTTADTSNVTEADDNVTTLRTKKSDTTQDTEAPDAVKTTRASTKDEQNEGDEDATSGDEEAEETPRGTRETETDADADADAGEGAEDDDALGTTTTSAGTTGGTDAGAGASDAGGDAGGSGEGSEAA